MLEAEVKGATRTRAVVTRLQGARTNELSFRECLRKRELRDNAYSHNGKQSGKSKGCRRTHHARHAHALTIFERDGTRFLKYSESGGKGSVRRT